MDFFPLGDDGVTVFGPLGFAFLTLVCPHMQKYDMKPSFNLCSSSQFKCFWKKHFIESSAVNSLP